MTEKQRRERLDRLGRVLGSADTLHLSHDDLAAIVVGESRELRTTEGRTVQVQAPIPADFEARAGAFLDVVLDGIGPFPSIEAYESYREARAVFMGSGLGDTGSEQADSGATV